MKAYSSKSANKGFTIVELLTVISVIAILIGLMVPALQEVKKIAKDIQQKAQFHSIGVALDIFQNEFEEYPESTNLSNGVTGAHKLAEALVGRDLQGFDTISDFNPATNYAGTSKDDEYATGASEDISLARRKGPYLNMEKGGAYDLSVVYKDQLSHIQGGNVGLYANSNLPAPVLVDVYRHKKTSYLDMNNNTVTVKVGAPILYFKANTATKEFENSADGVNETNCSGLIYNYNHNELLFRAYPLTGQSEIEPYNLINANNIDPVGEFYDDITNPQITTITRPYNPDTYILLSAGADAIYGTSDDIWNFSD